MNEQMNDNQIKHMVDRFLGWKLPGDFNPDGGISFKKSINENRPSWPQKNEPTGTNLFDADQAEEMVRYMVAEVSPEPEATAEDSTKWAGSGNYIADRVEAPQWVEFANGRTVGIVMAQREPHLVVGWTQPGEARLRKLAAQESDAGVISVGGFVADLAPLFEGDSAPEVQAPAVTDERPKCPDCNSVGMSHCSDPEHCGGVYWPDSKYQALRDELAQLRARVAILDAQKTKLPELPSPTEEQMRLAVRLCNSLGIAISGVAAEVRVTELLQRERQLLDALRAIQAQRTIMCDLRNGLVAARDFIDSGDSGWFPQKWRDAIAAYDALAGKDGE